MTTGRRTCRRATTSWPSPRDAYHSLAIRQVVPPDVLVSNLAEPVRDKTPIANPEFWAAQSFVSDNLRHSVSSIEAIVGNSLDSPQVVAELRKADVNNEIDLTAGGLLTTFTFADLPAGNPAAHLFSPEHSVNLEPNTRYWFVLGSSNEGTFDWSYAEGGHFIGPGTLSDFADSSDAGTTWTYGAGPFNPYLIQVKIADYVLPGDYNHNGIVDAADYVVWRNSLGQIGHRPRRPTATITMKSTPTTTTCGRLTSGETLALGLGADRLALRHTAVGRRARARLARLGRDRSDSLPGHHPPFPSPAGWPKTGLDRPPTRMYTCVH